MLTHAISKYYNWICITENLLCSGKEGLFLIIFKLKEKIYECVELKSLTCKVLYSGEDKSYFLLVDDKSLYSANNDGGIFDFEYIKDVEVAFENEKIPRNYLLK
ncbi:hypothetical protein P22_2641 [Propionispora sp. 2/2-37]|nr:hypothetical protein P22_2641 [Propionispora sp. 2/2-37]